jgi:MYXO-CTERM domain-containing protein
VIGMNHGRYQALDVATGATAWKFDASGQVGLSSPLVMGDRIYTFPGDANASVFAANADTGAAVSGFPVSIPDPSPIAGAQRVGPGPAPSSPMSIDGLVIVQLRRNETLPSKFVPPPVSMREYVVAIDPISAQVRWQVLIASRTGDNTNDIPELNMCATPAGFSNGDTSYVAVSSSLTGRVSVLDARTGQERWAAALSGPGRASPVLSNGFLLVATDAGVLHAFKSKSNQAPMPPAKVGPPGGELAFAASGVRLDWSGAEDADGGPLSYRVRVEREDQPETRIDTDTAPGESSLTFKASPGVAYLVAVRTRDAQGALSEWSAPQSIRVGPDLPPPAAATMPANTTTPVETMTPGAPVGTMPPMSEAAPAATPPAASPASSSVPIVTDSTGPSGGCSVPGDRGGAAGALLFVGLLAVRRRHQGKVTDA